MNGPAGSESREPAAPDSPKMRPWLLVVVYFLVVCCTGQTIAAVDPMQEMLLASNGVPNWIFGRQVDQSVVVKSIVGFGVSCSVIAGMPVGLYLNAFGPRLTALTGQTLQFSGMILIFFTHSFMWMCLGSAFLGIAFQAILNSHMCITVFFPERMSLVLAIIGAAPDVSLMLPACMKSIALQQADAAYGVTRVVQFYVCVIVLTCAIVDFILLPVRAFDTNGSSLTRSSTDQGLTPKSSFDDGAVDRVDSYGSLSRSLSRSSHMNSTDGGVERSYWDMTVSEQLRTSHLWVFSVFFIFNFLRRKHFAANIRSIFLQICDGDASRAGRWVDTFNLLVPFGFVPAVLWGFVTDSAGLVPAIVLNNICGVLVTFFPTIPWVPIQSLTLLAYVLNSSYVFGILFAFCATTYGFMTLATLQGICSSLAGLASLCMDGVWFTFIRDTLSSRYDVANGIVTFVGLLLFAVPLFFKLRPPPPIDIGEFFGGLTSDQPKFEFAYRHTTIGQLYDRHSLGVMQSQKMPYRVSTSAGLKSGRKYLRAHL